MAVINGNLPMILNTDKINVKFRLNNSTESIFCKCGIVKNQELTLTSPLEIRTCAKHSKHLFTIVKYVAVCYGEKINACDFTNRCRDNDADGGCVTVTAEEAANRQKPFLFTEDIITLLAEKCPKLTALRITGADLTTLPSGLVKRMKSMMTSLIELTITDCYKVSAFNERSFNAIIYQGRAIRCIVIGESRAVDDATIRRLAGTLASMTMLTIRNCANVTYRSLIYISEVLDKIGMECQVNISNEQKPFEERTLIQMLVDQPQFEWYFDGATDFRPKTLNIRKKSCPYRFAKLAEGRFFVERLRF